MMIKRAIGINEDIKITENLTLTFTEINNRFKKIKSALIAGKCAYVLSCLLPKFMSIYLPCPIYFC